MLHLASGNRGKYLWTMLGLWLFLFWVTVLPLDIREKLGSDDTGSVKSWYKSVTLILFWALQEHFKSENRCIFNKTMLSFSFHWFILRCNFQLCGYALSFARTNHFATFMRTATGASSCSNLGTTINTLGRTNGNERATISPSRGWHESDPWWQVTPAAAPWGPALQGGPSSSASAEKETQAAQLCVGQLPCVCVCVCSVSGL